MTSSTKRERPRPTPKDERTGVDFANYTRWTLTASGAVPMPPRGNG
ncbi:hypothetical protein ABE437_18800 [Isoptericola cucumis]